MGGGRVVPTVGRQGGFHGVNCEEGRKAGLRRCTLGRSKLRFSGRNCPRPTRNDAVRRRVAMCLVNMSEETRRVRLRCGLEI